MLKQIPENADMLQVSRGMATLIKKDIFKNLMWYVLPDSSKQYPLTIERVRKIRSLNQQNIIPEELEAVEVTGKPKEIEPEFVDVVGHITLKSLEKADKKKQQKAREQRQQQQKQLPKPNQQKGGPQQQQQRPQQQKQTPKPNQQLQKGGPQQQQRPQQQKPQQRPPQQPQQRRPNNPNQKKD